MPYWRLHYHAIWSCKNREPLITPELQPELYQYLERKIFGLGGIYHAVGGIADHLHTAFSLPPKHAVADFIGKLKGASSHWVTHVLKHSEPFDWQRGYGVLSFGDANLPKVVRYVRNQKQHHAKQKLNLAMETWCEEDDGVTAVYTSQMQPDDESSGPI